jgi:hypothetical protein
LQPLLAASPLTYPAQRTKCVGQVCQALALVVPGWVLALVQVVKPAAVRGQGLAALALVHKRQGP